MEKIELSRLDLKEAFRMHDDHQKNMNKSKNLQLENERRIDNLIDVVEKHTRTERHLEQYEDSGITSPENIDHAKKVQSFRENEIDNLKNIITSGKHANGNQLENVKKRYEYTEGYLNHNADTMESDTLKNTIEKQEHRKEQIDGLE